jgi:hypothetical protein
MGKTSNQTWVATQSPHTVQALAIHWNGLCRPIPGMPRLQLSVGNNMSSDKPGAPHSNLGANQDNRVGLVLHSRHSTPTWHA